MVKLEDIIPASRAQQQPIITITSGHTTPIARERGTWSHNKPRTYLVVGASRGIGLEFVRQLLTQSCQVIAVVRSPDTASQLWHLMNNTARPHQCIIEQCDVSDPSQIDRLVLRIRNLIERGATIDTMILNAGILQYHKGLGSMQVDFADLMNHLCVNCVGNVILARKLLELNDLPSLRQERERERTLFPLSSLTTPSSRDRSSSRQSREGNEIREGVKRIKIEDTYYSSSDDDGPTSTSATATPRTIGRQLVFISSDSGSMGDFREYEDGFAAYGASKAALNMMIRHMAVELRRKSERYQQEQMQQQSTIDNSSNRLPSIPAKSTIRGAVPWESQVCVLAMHPGEVATDMANINADLDWEVEGVISPEESVASMLKVLRDKGPRDSGTFWRWDGNQHPW